MKAIKSRIWLVAIALIATALGACTSDRLDVDEGPNKDVLQMTADEYVEYVKKVMAEDAKLTDKELMAKYRIF